MARKRIQSEQIVAILREAQRGGASAGSLPKALYLRTNVLSLEAHIWRAGGVQSASDQSLGRGKLEVEVARRGTSPSDGDAERTAQTTGVALSGDR